ncbi:hypothetical protein OBBRIDRAFT_826077 [Obba rivulosa]|uniref:Uncharacterized protein n=1 Tax=Obba rivulosa TaxID=1052685 RepID=A0A8E2DNK9_9APHY|nr:hypothetical protein OBBRIDRAFT_826077 [Obba rivulosa]
MLERQPYTLRLPSYRSSYLNRYHPYPRSKRPHDRWLNELLPVDQPVDQPAATYSPPPASLSATESGHDSDVSTLDLGDPAAGHGPREVLRDASQWMCELALAWAIAVQRACLKLTAARTRSTAEKSA